jgi:hypothetical protein
MKQYVVLTICLFVVSTLCLSAPIEFTAQLGSKSSNDVPAELELDIVEGITLTLTVTTLTDIKDAEGDPISLVDLEVDDFLKIEAAFVNPVWIGLEIERVEDADTELELKGTLEEISADSIAQVNGFEVEILDTTNIRDEFGSVISVEELGARIPVQVNVEALAVEGQLVASSIKIMPNFVKIVLEGIVVSDPPPSDSGFSVDIGSVVVPVLITENTEIEGNIEPGVLVWVQGHVNEGLITEAYRIRVKHLFELVPDDIHMGFDETRQVSVALERAFETPVVLQLCNSDPSLVAVPDSLEIPAGNLTESFEVMSYTASGKTEIRVSPGSCESGNSRVLKVEVGESSEEPNGELEIKWVPPVIRAAPNGTRTVRLILKHGTAEEDLEVSLSSDLSPELIVIPEMVTIPQGESWTAVYIEFLSQSMKGVVTASLNGVSDELDIELKVPGKKDEEGDEGDDKNGKGNGGNSGRP